MEEMFLKIYECIKMTKVLNKDELKQLEKFIKYRLENGNFFYKILNDLSDTIDNICNSGDLEISNKILKLQRLYFIQNINIGYSLNKHTLNDQEKWYLFDTLNYRLLFELYSNLYGAVMTAYQRLKRVQTDYKAKKIFKKRKNDKQY